MRRQQTARRYDTEDNARWKQGNSELFDADVDFQKLRAAYILASMSLRTFLLRDAMRDVRREDGKSRYDRPCCPVAEFAFLTNSATDSADAQGACIDLPHSPLVPHYFPFHSRETFKLRPDEIQNTTCTLPGPEGNSS